MHVTKTISAALAVLLGAASVAGAQRGRDAPLDLLEHHAFARRTLVQVDSVRIEVAHDTVGWKIVSTAEWLVMRPDTSAHGGFARVRVLTPTGTFSVGADSVMVAAWADSAATLRGPVAVKAKRGGATELSLSGVLLREVDGATVMRIVRLTSDGDSVSAYQLDASNGAWGGGVRLRGEKARAFFDALRGTATPGHAKGEGDSLRVDGTVNVPARWLGGPAPLYPIEARAQGKAGDVQLSFVVGTDGRADPASLELVGNPIPEFAAAVRESVLHSRYAPATRNGAPVRVEVQQRFAFRVR